MIILQSAKISVTGEGKTHNEGWVNYYEPIDHRERAHNGCVYLVADGVGSGHIGALASRQVVEKAMQIYRNDPANDISARLRHAFQEANKLVYRQKKVLASSSNMGTTLVAVAIQEQKAYVANVGNSRAYIIREAHIQQITQDHSLVTEQPRRESLFPEQASRSPQQDKLTRIMGQSNTVKVDLFEGSFLPGDILVLCTRSLTKYLSDGEIGGIALKYEPDDAVEHLVTLAKQRGGECNISAIVVRAISTAVLSNDFLSEKGDTKELSPKNRAQRWIGVMLVLAAVAAIIGGMWVYSQEIIPLSPNKTPTTRSASPQVSPSKPLSTVTESANTPETSVSWKYAVPSLSYPHDKAIVMGKEPTPILKWQAENDLEIDEWYEVQIGRVGEPKAFSRLRVKDGELRLAEHLFPGTYWWRVVVVEVDKAGQAVALSSPSERWEFNWLPTGTDE